MKIDEYMPHYCFSEFHKQIIKAPLDIVYQKTSILDLRQSFLINLLVWLRGLYARIDMASTTARIEMTLKYLTEKAGWMLLDKEPNKEIIIGLVGNFWRPNAGMISMSAEQYKAFSESGFAKVVMNFYFQKGERGDTILSTETRINTYGRQAKILFSMYWLIVRPFSGLIRRLMLKEIKRQSIAEMHDN